MSGDLVAFLLARLAEIERKNRVREEPEDWCDRASGLHFDHAYVTADVASKRALIEVAGWLDNYPAPLHAFTCRPSTLVLRNLAAPFAGHPDYREEWKP